jgi:hypothetical protein
MPNKLGKNNTDASFERYRYEYVFRFFKVAIRANDVDSAMLGTYLQLLEARTVSGLLLRDRLTLASTSHVNPPWTSARAKTAPRSSNKFTVPKAQYFPGVA